MLMPPKPRVLSDDEMIQVEALAAVLTTEQLADYLGIARRTFYDILERQPDVSAHYKRGKAKAVGNIAKNLVQKAQNGDTASMIFYLKTQAGWRETVQVDNTSSDGSMSPKGLSDFYADVSAKSET